MTLLVKKGTFAINTTDSGTVVVTGVGFRPKLVLFWLGDGLSTAADPFAGTTVGAYDGTNQWSWLGFADKNSSVAYCVWSSSHVLYGRTSSVGTGLRYAGSALDADGFTVAVTNAAVVAATVHYVAIGGSSFSATVGTSVLPTSNGGTQTISGLSFQPNALLAVAGEAKATAASEAADGRGALCFGFASGASAEACVASMSRAVDASDAMSTAHGRLLSLFNLWGERARLVDLNAFTSDGFTVNVSGGTDTANTEATRYGYVAMNAPFAYAGVTTLGTSTGTFDVTAAGFLPELMIAAVAPSVTAENALVANGHYAFGATDGSSHGGTSYLDVDALSPPDRYSAGYTDAILKGYERTGAATFGVESALTFDSWLSNGVRLDQTDAAPSTGRVAMLLLGDTAASKRPLWLR